MTGRWCIRAPLWTICGGLWLGLLSGRAFASDCARLLQIEAQTRKVAAAERLLEITHNYHLRIVLLQTTEVGSRVEELHQDLLNLKESFAEVRWWRQWRLEKAVREQGLVEKARVLFADLPKLVDEGIETGAFNRYSAHPDLRRSWRELGHAINSSLTLGEKHSELLALMFSPEEHKQIFLRLELAKGRLLAAQKDFSPWIILLEPKQFVIRPQSRSLELDANTLLFADVASFRDDRTQIRLLVVKRETIGKTVGIGAEGMVELPGIYSADLLQIALQGSTLELIFQDGKRAEIMLNL